MQIKITQINIKLILLPVILFSLVFSFFSFRTSQAQLLIESDSSKSSPNLKSKDVNKMLNGFPIGGFYKTTLHQTD